MKPVPRHKLYSKIIGFPRFFPFHLLNLDGHQRHSLPSGMLCIKTLHKETRYILCCFPCVYLWVIKKDTHNTLGPLFQTYYFWTVLCWVCVRRLFYGAINVRMHFYIPTHEKYKFFNVHFIYCYYNEAGETVYACRCEEMTVFWFLPPQPSTILTLPPRSHDSRQLRKYLINRSFIYVKRVVILSPENGALLSLLKAHRLNWRFLCDWL